MPGCTGLETSWARPGGGGGVTSLSDPSFLQPPLWLVLGRVYVPKRCSGLPILLPGGAKKPRREASVVA